MPNRVEVMLWREVLVLCDDGRSVVADYAELFEIAQELHTRCPHGWGLVIIIPPNAVPPSDPVRKAISAAFADMQSMLRGATWAIEGSGFQSAMARAVLTGMRFLTNAPYPRSVCSSVEESLAWLLPLLTGGESRLDELEEMQAYIASRRGALARFPSGIRATTAKGVSKAD